MVIQFESPNNKQAVGCESNPEHSQCKPCDVSGSLYKVSRNPGVVADGHFLFTVSAGDVISPSMKSFITYPASSCAAVSTIVFASLCCASAQEIKLPLKESGAMQKIGYYMPQRLE